jgi:hypothetical protein
MQRFSKPSHRLAFEDAASSPAGGTLRLLFDGWEGHVMVTRRMARGVFDGGAWKATVDLASQLDADTLSGRVLDGQLARRLARVIILLDDEGAFGVNTTAAHHPDR